MKLQTSWLALAAALRLLTACSQAQTGQQSPDLQDLDGGQEVNEDGQVAPERADDAATSTQDSGADSAANQNEECADRFLNEDEECDDGNQQPGDGCSATCKVEEGYACPIVGARCRPAACGDLIMVGDEECEDGNSDPLDGCDERCRIEDGYACGAAGEACHPATCGDSQVEGREQCDDGNDTPYDGCYGCIKEPACGRDGCAAVCGDGIKFPGEGCDDGNLRSGDGCSAACALEEGFACTESAEAPPDFVDLPIILRDFRGRDLAAVPSAGLAAGHPDFEDEGGPSEQGIVEELLSSDKKPIYASGSGSTTTTSAEMFDKWYRDDPAYNRTIVETVRLQRNGAGDYVFVDQDFFPLDDRGFVAEGHEIKRNDGHNFHFTSEVRTWFSYQGGERLDFLGDDDVWVFVNGHLAVDLGGVHAQLPGSVTLDASGTDARFDIKAGNIYEIVVFQAERHTSESKYRLTLRNFIKARTTCEGICGDGVLTPDEACDDKLNAGGYGECATGCVFGPRCGDGVMQAENGEQCDDKNRNDRDGCSNTCETTLVM